jgi:hypothetical protein
VTAGSWNRRKYYYLYLLLNNGTMLIAGAEANPNESKGKAYEYNHSSINVGSDCYFFNRIAQDLQIEGKEITASG